MKNKNLDKIQSAKARGFQCLVSFIAFIGSCVSLYYFVPELLVDYLAMT